MSDFKKKSVFSGKWIYLTLVFSVLTVIVIAIISINNTEDFDLSSENFGNSSIETEEKWEDVKKDRYPVRKNPEEQLLENDKIQKAETKSETKNNEDDGKSKVSKKQEEKVKLKPKKDKELKFSLPVEGTVLQKYSNNDMVKSETLHDWRTHNGVDIAAAENVEVKAILDGTVIDVSNDTDRWGICVTIDHGDGLKSCYRGLGPNPTVKLDEMVKAGDVIGSVGDSNKIEGALEKHLHFELTKDEKFVDPEKYIKI